MNNKTNDGELPRTRYGKFIEKTYECKYKQTYAKFIETFDSGNTQKVARSLYQLGEHDYSNCTPIDVEQIILSMKPGSPKAITTISYMLSLYAKYLGNDDLYHISKDIDRSALWSMAKPMAKKKFISYPVFKSVYNEIGVYEEYNAFYIQTLFRCLYEGIYSDDMSVIKNLRGSDIHQDKCAPEVYRNTIKLREDDGHEYELLISNGLAEDLRKLSQINIWERRNRFGTCRINITGLYEDSCFKVENRKGSKEYAYRYTYYRILRKISKEYLEYNLLPLQLYASGIMYRIKANLKMYDIDLEEAFSNRNKNRIVNKVILEELRRCNYNIEVKNFREMVSGHLDMFV